MTKKQWFFLFEIAVSSLLALLIAKALHLETAFSASIIAILSIQNTKKQALALALERTIFFIFAMAIAYLNTLLLGFSPYSFALFVLIFTTLCYTFNGMGSLSIACVLISHFYISQRWDKVFIINEMLLLTIGVGFGLLLNAFTPTSLASLRKKQQQIEEAIKAFLIHLSHYLEGNTSSPSPQEDLKNLSTLLDTGTDEALAFRDNALFSPDSTYYIRYMAMRKNQHWICRHLFETAKGLEGDIPQRTMISNFLVEISTTFHESNNAKGLLTTLETLKTHYRQSPLPVTRNEFEQRATLYLMLIEIEQFLLLKEDFIKNLSPKEVKTFEKNLLDYHGK